jgi:3-oxoacyl-[acyl-carrier protein] reductase
MQPICPVSRAHPTDSRLVRPDEVTETFAFLVSEYLGFSTGHYLPLKGGFAMK